ncbi:MarR family transcriptional regulator [Streptomyces sp. S1D4-11]|nr:MarR family transcriptional regulator [Streptomyces sp. S1D4-11]
MLVVLSTRGATKLVALAELLQVAPSTAMRMVDRLIAAGLLTDAADSPHANAPAPNLSSSPTRAAGYDPDANVQFVNLWRRSGTKEQTAMITAKARSLGEPPLGLVGWSDGDAVPGCVAGRSPPRCGARRDHRSMSPARSGGRGR